MNLVLGQGRCSGSSLKAPYVTALEKRFTITLPHSSRPTPSSRPRIVAERFRGRQVGMVSGRTFRRSKSWIWFWGF